MLPHPFPYQGSKRKIAGDILKYFPANVDRLIEPFCGAAAVSIAAMGNNLAKKIVLNDLNEPLMDLWEEILRQPHQLSDGYEQLWHEGAKGDCFYRVREEFNISHEPRLLLYLLARIVKGSVRYSHQGTFNQSADNRRKGMRPKVMRQNILGVANLLADITTLSSVDFSVIVNQAKEDDLIYMDPPYQGTSRTKDHRYLRGVAYDDFVSALFSLNERGASYIVSYDGATGEKKHGKWLPKALSLKHLFVHAGRSTQSTLLGGREETIESLYLSPALVERLHRHKPRPFCPQQLEIALT